MQKILKKVSVAMVMALAIMVVGMANQAFAADTYSVQVYTDAACTQVAPDHAQNAFINAMWEDNNDFKVYTHEIVYGPRPWMKGKIQTLKIEEFAPEAIGANLLGGDRVEFKYEDVVDVDSSKGYKAEFKFKMWGMFHSTKTVYLKFV